MENINKLFQVLDEQSKAYQDLLDVSKSKKNVLIEGKVQELENITKLEQTFILKMGSLESELDKVVGELVKEYDINDKNINVSIILKYLNGDEKTKLEKQRDQIINTIKELDHTNKLNSQLIKSSLDYINFSVNLISNASTEDGGGYEQSGDIKGSKKNFFDAKY